jgi:hypothetical protein
MDDYTLEEKIQAILSELNLDFARHECEYMSALKEISGLVAPIT